MIVAKGNLKGKLNIGKEYVQPTTQEKTVTPTEQIQEILPDINIDALSKVTVNAIPEEYLRPDEIDYLKITETDQEGNEYFCYLYKPKYSAEAIAEAEAIINGDGLLIQVLGFLAQPDPNNLANLPYLFEMIGIERVEKLFRLSRLVDTYTIAASSLDSIGFIELSSNSAGENGFAIQNVRFSAIITIEENTQTGEKSVNIGETHQFISPQGTTQITENGTYDVREFESAEINVEGSSPVVIPKGMIVAESSFTELPDWLKTAVLTEINSLYRFFNRCNKLITADVSKWNVSNITSFSQLFQNCTSLKNINVSNWNIDNATSVYLMFSNCGELTNESLNSILKMCSTNTKVSNKTLQQVGLSQSQATTCTTLSNWQDCVSAGWSTGY